MFYDVENEPLRRKNVFMMYEISLYGAQNVLWRAKRASSVSAVVPSSVVS
jgi:hypothetical protein